MAEAAGATSTTNTSTGTTVVNPDNTSTGGPSGVQNAGGGAGPVVVPPAAAPNWYDSLPDTQKSYVIQKGFKGVDAVIDSYVNLEKLRGVPEDRLLKLPEKMDAPEMADIYNRLGRPKTSAEYVLPTPEGQKEDVEFKKWAQGQFHELGLSKSQGEKLATKWNEFATSNMEKIELARKQEFQAQDDALKKEWGAAYEKQTDLGKRAVKAFGLDEGTIDKLESALGYGGVMKFMSSIGAKLGEGDFVQGGQTRFDGALTPDVAKAKIDALRADKEWGAKYLAGGAKEKEEMERLMRFAFPGNSDGKGYTAV